ncbi:MAG: hypothetical protein KAR42_13810 [candidate division Zixibacteria bacterium]|nr:hypothetical protein [candidate division Zixibacteria bacterium]
MKKKYLVATVVFITAFCVGYLLYGLIVNSYFNNDNYPMYSSSPEDLLNNNEYVFIGYLTNVDTLQVLGKIDYKLHPVDLYFLEYQYEVIEPIKGVQKSDTIHLWCSLLLNIDISISHHWISGDKQKLHLIYGNKISITDDLYNTNIVYSRKLTRIQKEIIQSGEQQGWVEDYTTLYSLTVENDYLVKEFRNRSLNQLLIYGTETTYSTHRAFNEGKLAYKLSSPQPTEATSEEYLDILRNINHK